MGLYLEGTSNWCTLFMQDQSKQWKNMLLKWGKEMQKYKWNLFLQFQKSETERIIQEIITNF